MYIYVYIEIYTYIHKMAGVLKHTVFESPIIPMGYNYEIEVKCMYIFT
jgi:hypothetical protein